MSKTTVEMVTVKATAMTGERFTVRVPAEHEDAAEQAIRSADTLDSDDGVHFVGSRDMTDVIEEMGGEFVGVHVTARHPEDGSRLEIECTDAEFGEAERLFLAADPDGLLPDGRRLHNALAEGVSIVGART